MMKDLEALFSPAVTEVFTTMLDYPTIEVNLESPDAIPTNGELHLASGVGIVGESTGDEIVNDAMGEIANMVIGYIKSRLCEKGTVCMITIPSIVRGSHFRIEPVGVDDRRVFILKCDDGQFWAEALVKNDAAK